MSVPHHVLNDSDHPDWIFFLLGQQAYNICLGLPNGGSSAEPAGPLLEETYHGPGKKTRTFYVFTHSSINLFSIYLSYVTLSTVVAAVFLNCVADMFFCSGQPPPRFSWWPYQVMNWSSAWVGVSCLATSGTQRPCPRLGPRCILEDAHELPVGSLGIPTRWIPTPAWLGQYVPSCGLQPEKSKQYRIEYSPQSRTYKPYWCVKINNNSRQEYGSRQKPRHGEHAEASD